MPNDLPYQIGFCIVAFFTLGLPFLAPSIIGFKRKRPKLWLIIFCNVFLGWTILGWGLAMALAVDDR